MIAQIKQWGNSLAIRIPKVFSKELEMFEDTQVDITMDGDAIVIRKYVQERRTLEDMLASVTNENLHTDLLSGPLVGKEVI